jgi:uncharacterized membrane protein
VSKDDWLLVFHVFGAFFFVSGAVAIAVFQLATLRRERPSEIALLFRLSRVAERLINVGALLTIGFGIWLVEDLPCYKLSDGWIVAAIVLWVASAALGGIGGSRYRQAREEAERLAAGDDQPTPELRALVRDRAAFLLSWASGLTLLAILVLMIWKPGKTS